MDAGRYKNKLFSLMGDSVSTLAGYSEPEGFEFYKGMNKFKAGVFAPEDTWWGQVIAKLGGELLVNNSIAGSMVCKSRGCEIPSYACSDERTASLHRSGAMPDVIMVFMGINDWGCAASPEGIFTESYCTMLEKLRKNYPLAELWCFTLPVSTRKTAENFEFPYCYGGRHIAEYCAAIRACAEKYGCRTVELYSPAEPYDTADDFHPNLEGMQTLADAILNSVMNE